MELSFELATNKKQQTHVKFSSTSSKKVDYIGVVFYYTYQS